MRELTEALRSDHHYVERLLRVLAAVCDHCEAGEPVDAAALESIVALARELVDERHDALEEKLLFPALRRVGVGRRTALAGMLAQHELGRGLLAVMESAATDVARGELTAGDLFAEAARRYVELLADHMTKEDDVLFRLADRILSPRARAELAGELVRRTHEADPAAGEHPYERRLSKIESTWLGPLNEPAGRRRSEHPDPASGSPDESCR